MLADRRHAPETRQQEAADGLEALAFDRDLEQVRHLLDVDLAAEHEAAPALVDDGLDLDVVLVADLADDLLEQVLDRDQAGGAAVLVDDDGALHALALELLEQLGHPLGLGHEVRGPHQRRNRPDAGVVGVPDQVLDERRSRRRCRACSSRPGCANTAARGTARRALDRRAAVDGRRCRAAAS